LVRDSGEHLAGNPYLARFLAVLEDMDRELGRLVDAIDALGLGESTLIVLTSDNGPTAWPSYYRQGFTPPGDTGGLRGRKWSLYEGGIRMPLIARWVGTIPAGRVDETTVMAAIDLLPTLCELADLEPPPVDLDGVAMGRALLGDPQVRGAPIFWEFGRDETYVRPFLREDRSPGLAVRDGRWKLLRDADGSRTELFDLATPEGERRNVADRHPEVVRRLSAELGAWWRSLAPPAGE